MDGKVTGLIKQIRKEYSILQNNKLQAEKEVLKLKHNGIIPSDVEERLMKKFKDKTTLFMLEE